MWNETEIRHWNNSWNILDLFQSCFRLISIFIRMSENMQMPKLFQCCFMSCSHLQTTFIHLNTVPNSTWSHHTRLLAEHTFMFEFTISSKSSGLMFGTVFTSSINIRPTELSAGVCPCYIQHCIPTRTSPSTAEFTLCTVCSKLSIAFISAIFRFLLYVT